jgi:CoA:oxalate CoA-transferase
MGRPLSGLRIIDLTHFLAGPYATMILGDLGAEVIKIENQVGDATRALSAHSYKGEGAYFLSINRNKKSVVLDLKEEAGRTAFYDLCRLSDVLIESFRPGVTKRLEIDYPTIKQINSKLIYCSVTGFGQSGPYSELPAYDMIVQALSGGMSLTGEIQGRPVRAGLPIGDLGGGLFSAIAILAALNERTHSGMGQYIDVAMLDTQISMLTYQATSFFVSGNVPGPQGREHMYIPTYRAFETKDRLNIVVTANTEEMWQSLCKILGLEHLANDPLFARNQDRLENSAKLVPILESKFREDTASRWLAKLRAEGVPAAPINQIDKALSDSQTLSRNMVVDVTHSLGGEIKLLGNPIKMSRTPCEEFASPPTLGQHTTEVLRDVLGYLPEKIQEYEKNGSQTKRKKERAG